MKNNSGDKKDISAAYKIVMNNELYNSIISSISDPASKLQVETAVEEYARALSEGLAKQNKKTEADQVEETKQIVEGSSNGQ